MEPNDSGKHSGDRDPAWKTASILLLLTLVVRLPFFFPALIDWDESTFMVVGQAILDGQVLYVDVWDNKPPLAFAFFAAVLAVVGKSIVGVRLSAALCVALASWIACELAAVAFGRKAGYWAGAICVGLMSFVPSGQAAMTEHVAMAALMAAVFVLATREWTLPVVSLAGVLVAAAGMARMNLAFVAVGLAIGLALLQRPPGFGPTLGRIAAYSMGGVSVVVLTASPWIVSGHFEVWWSAVVLAPLRFASQDTTLGALTSQASFILASLSGRGDSIFGISVLGWLGGAAGWMATAWRWRGLPSESKRVVSLMTCALVPTAFSVVRSGASHPHYLIQLAPFMAFGAGSFWAACADRRRRATLLLAILLASLSLVSVAREYRTVLVRLLEGTTLAHGAAYDIAAFLKAEGLERRTTLLLTDHVVHVLVGTRPFTPSVTHPSSISKPFLLSLIHRQDTSSDQEMKALLDAAPEVIVTRPRLSFLEGSPELQRAQRLLDSELNMRYRLIREIDGRRIYLRVGEGDGEE